MENKGNTVNLNEINLNEIIKLLEDLFEYAMYIMREANECCGMSFYICDQLTNAAQMIKHLKELASSLEENKFEKEIKNESNIDIQSP